MFSLGVPLVLIVSVSGGVAGQRAVQCPPVASVQEPRTAAWGHAQGGRRSRLGTAAGARERGASNIIMIHVTS